MRNPIDITIRNIEHTPAIESRIRQKAEKLFGEPVEFCKVVVETAQKSKHQGKEYTVHIELGVTGTRLVVDHNRDEDLYVAIRDAFYAMQRKLAAYQDKQRGDIKSHKPRIVGKVVRLFEDYGFIESTEGEEYYFNSKNMLHPNFDDVIEGMMVEFMENIGGDGLQATHVIALTTSETE